MAFLFKPLVSSVVHRLGFRPGSLTETETQELLESPYYSTVEIENKRTGGLFFTHIYYDHVPFLIKYYNQDNIEDSKVNFPTIIFSHGNSERIYDYILNINNFSEKYRSNICIYEYSGYAPHTNKNVGEYFVYEDILTIYNHLTSTLSIPTNNIILWGRSLGSGPTYFLAEKLSKMVPPPPIKGVVIASGLRSVATTIDLTAKAKKIPGDIFENFEKAPNIIYPTLFFHGTVDPVIKFHQAYEMNNLLGSAVNNSIHELHTLYNFEHNYQFENNINIIGSYLRFFKLTDLNFFIGNTISPRDLRDILDVTDITIYQSVVDSYYVFIFESPEFSNRYMFLFQRKNNVIIFDIYNNSKSRYNSIAFSEYVMIKNNFSIRNFIDLFYGTIYDEFILDGSYTLVGSIVNDLNILNDESSMHVHVPVKKILGPFKAYNEIQDTTSYLSFDTVLYGNNEEYTEYPRYPMDLVITGKIKLNPQGHIPFSRATQGPSSSTSPYIPHAPTLPSSSAGPGPSSSAGPGPSSSAGPSSRHMQYITSDICKMTIYDFNNFDISDKMIGKGGFAKVFEGLNRITGNKVAVKVINEGDLRVSMRVNENILNECNILKKINHPNIIRSYGAYHDKYNHNIYWFLELLEGGDLFKYMTMYDLFPQQIFLVFNQLLNAINYCHSLNIVHRDIKLENIGLREKDNLKDVVLLDFGFATFQKKNGPLLTDYIGTERYAAPELWDNIPYDGRKVDIYAAGVCLYRMIFRREVDKTNELFFSDADKHMLTTEKYPDDLVIKMLNGMLARDPAKRWGDVEDIISQTRNIRRRILGAK